MSYLAVVTTTDSREHALAIARVLIERRLAACVQLTDIESVYRWHGDVQEEREVRLLCKTTTERYADVEAALRELHTYALPAIHAVALDRVDDAYAEWIRDATAS